MSDPRIEALLIALLIEAAERQTKEERFALADKLREISRTYDGAADQSGDKHRGNVAAELRGIAALLYRYPLLPLEPVRKLRLIGVEVLPRAICAPIFRC